MKLENYSEFLRLRTRQWLNCLLFFFLFVRHVITRVNQAFSMHLFVHFKRLFVHEQAQTVSLIALQDKKKKVN